LASKESENVGGASAL